MEHVVVLRIRPDSTEQVMTDEEIKKWILDHFQGCDYGKVSVETDWITKIRATKGN